MSTTIDDRVVQMRFDNKDFEKNVAITMSTLDKFKEKLKFRGTEQEFDAITKAADKVSLKHLEDSADSVGNKFSMMSVVAITAVSRMTDKILAQGERLIKSLSVDQITSGWDKYNTKVSKVQTIMNSTGKDIETVNEQLDRLMWYTDETSYNFIDMVDSIGKFTNNSVDLQLAVTAMQGISNWAGLVGANTQEASRAMYNLSQAIGTGTVKLIDWKSIENANMADATFKQMAIDAAVARGMLLKVGDAYTTLDKKIDVSVANFNEGLSKGWFTSDVLLDVLNEYGKFSDALYDAVESTGLGAREMMNAIDEFKDGTIDMQYYMDETGMTAEELGDIFTELGDETMEFSRKAFESGQISKTFSDAINAVKDAVSTGWMKSFEIIIGDLEKAKEVWGAFGDEMWEIFAGGADARNRMLEKWADMGGREMMLDTIAKAWNKLKKVVETVKKAFRNVFPKKTAQDIYNITYEIHHFIDSIELSEEALEGISKVVEKIAAVLKVFTTAAKIAVAVGLGLIIRLSKVVNNIISVATNSEKMKQALIDALGEERYTRLANALNQIFGNLINLFIYLKDKFNETFEGEGFSSKFISALEKVWDILEPLAMWVLDRIIDGLEIIAKMDFRPLFDMIGKGIKNLKGSLEGIADFFKPIGNVIEKLFADLKGDSPSEALNNLQNNIRSLNLDFKSFKNNFTMDGILAKIKTAAYGATDGIENVAKSIVNIIQKLEPGKILAFGFGTALTGLLYTAIDLTKSLANLATGFKGVATALQERIKPNKVAQISHSLILLAGALVIMSLVDSAKLKAATEAMMWLMGGLGILTAAIAAIERFILNKGNLNSGFKELVAMLLKLSASVLVLAAGLRVFSGIELNEDFVKKLGVLISIMGALVVAAIALSKWSKDLKTGGKTLLAYAASVWIIIKALQGLASADMSGIKDNIAELAIAMGSLIALSAIANRTGGFGGGMGIIATIAGIWLMIKLLKKLANEDASVLVKGLISFIPLGIALRMLFAGLRRAGSEAQKSGMGILAVAGALFIIAQVIKQVGAISVADVIQGGIVAAALMYFMKNLISVFKLRDGSSFENADKVGKSLLKLSIAIGILALSIKMIGAMSFEQAVQGLVSVVAMLVVFREIITSMKNVKGMTGPMIALTLVVGILSAAIVVLSLIPAKDAIAASVALSLALVAFGKAIGQLKEIKFFSAIGQAVLAGVLVATLTKSLSNLANKDWKSLTAAAVAMSACMISFGIAIKNIKDIQLEKSFSTIFGTLVGLGVIMLELTGIFYLMQGLNTDGLIEKATALSFALLASGVAIKSLNSISNTADWKNLAVSVVGVGVILLALSASFKILEGVDSTEMLKQAAIISGMVIVMGVLTVLMDIIGRITNYGKIVEGILGVASVIGGIALIVGILGAVYNLPDAKIIFNNGSDFLKLLGSLGLIIAEFQLLSVAMAVIGVLSPVILPGIIAFAEVIGGITLIVGILGAVSEIPGLEWLINKGVDVFTKIGNAIGTFFGEIVNGFVTSATSNLDKAGSQLSNFIINLQPFFEIVKDVDGNVLDGVNNFKDCLLGLCDILREYKSFNDDGATFLQFGANLAHFSIPFLTFALNVKMIGKDVVEATANSVKAIGEFVSLVASSRNFIDEVANGEIDFEKFGDGLGKFATGIRSFYFKIKDGDYDETFTAKADIIAKVCKTLNDNMPSAHGTFAYWFNGTMDLDTFGTKLASFGGAIKIYAETIKPITNWDQIERSGTAGEALGKLGKSLPAAEDAGFNYWFNGTMGLDDFGEKLKAFGQAYVDFAQTVSTMTDNDWDLATKCANAGLAMTALADELPSMDENGNFRGWFFSKNTNLETFGEQIVAFGKAVYLYYSWIANVKPDIVTASADAASALVKLANELPNSGWFTNLFSKNDIEDFGQKLQAFGESFQKYYNSIEPIDIGKVNQASLAISKISDLITGFKDLNTSDVPAFSRALQNLAELGIESFSTTFENSAENFKDIGVSFTDKIATGIRKNLQTIRDVAKEIVKALLDEIDSQQENLKSTAESFAFRVVDAFNKAGSEMVKSGENLIEGLIRGISKKQKDLNTSLTKVAKGSIQATEEAYEIESPSRKFMKIGSLNMQGLINGTTSRYEDLNTTMTNTSNSVIKTVNQIFDNTNNGSRVFSKIGNFVMRGIQNGISGGRKNAENAIVKASEGIMDATKKWWIIKSPSVRAKDEVGHYIIEGIAEGIDGNDSAEEIAKQKARNIVEAFQVEFDRLSQEANFEKLSLELFQKMYGDQTAEDEITRMQIETQEKLLSIQANTVRAALAQYEYQVKQFGEASEAALEAKTTYMEELSTMADLSSELISMKYGDTTETISWIDRATEQTDMINEYYQNLLDEGKSVEEAAKLRDDRQLQMLFYNSDMDMQRIQENQQYLSNYYDSLIAQGISMEEASKARFDKINGILAMYSKDRTSTSTGETPFVADVMSEYLGDLDNIESYVEEGIGNVVQKGVYNGVIDGFNSGMENIQNDFNDQKNDQINEAIGGSYAGWTTYLSDLIAGNLTDMQLKDVIGMAINSGDFDFIKPFLSEENLAKAKSWFSELGVSEVEGRNEGVESKLSEAANVSNKLAEIGLTAYADRSGIESPSKEYYKFGVYEIEGLILGLQDPEARARLIEVITEVAEEAMSVMQDYNPVSHKNGKTIMQKFSEGVKQGILFTEADIVKAIDIAITDALTPMFLQIGNRIGMAISQGIQTTIAPIVNSTLSGISQLTQGVYNAVNAAEQAAQQAANAVASSISSMVQSLTDGLAAMASAANGAQGIVDDLSGSFQNLNLGGNIGIGDAGLLYDLGYTRALAGQAGISGAMNNSNSVVNNYNTTNYLVEDNGTVRETTRAEDYRKANSASSKINNATRR